MMNVLTGRLFLKKAVLVLLVLALAFPPMLVAQSGGSLRGQVSDPSGAVVPGAAVTLTQGSIVLNGQSGNDGVYLFKAVPSGSYSLTVQAEGFATFSKPGIVIAAGQARQLNVALAIAVQQQDVTVNDQAAGPSVNPDENASALVVKEAISMLSPTILTNCRTNSRHSRGRQQGRAVVKSTSMVSPGAKSLPSLPSARFA